MGQLQTVHMGELEGLHLQTADQPLAALISLNNTFALTHSTNPGPLSGQYLHLTIWQAFGQLKRTRADIHVSLSWLPESISPISVCNSCIHINKNTLCRVLQQTAL